MISVTRAELRRVVVAVDPAVTSHEDSDDTGIVVVARGPHQPETCELDRCPGHGYVLDDCTCHLPPHGWAKVAIAAYHKWDAVRLVAEVNQGYDLVENTLRAIEPGIPYKPVKARQSKLLRAEPASALHEQGRIHMMGVFPELEQQMTTWTPESTWSPDRLDALVHGLVELGLIGGQGQAFLTAYSEERQLVAAAAHLPKGPEGLPRLTAYEQPEPCKCRQPRFFEGVCVHCGGPVVA